jgi:PAS domain S-box-containing protein
MSDHRDLSPQAPPGSDGATIEGPPSPALDADEARADALRRTGLLDSPPEEAFDRITRLATRVLGTPVSLISLVDADRQFFKSQQGLPEPWATRRETPLSHSLCRHVTASGRPFVVEDARTDPRAARNRAVPDLGIVAYLGVPLIDAEGQALGALCAIDHQPRDWTPEDEAALTDLARIAMNEVALRRELNERRRAEDELRRTEERYRLAVKATNDAIWDWDLATDHVLWNEAVRTLFGYRPETVGSSGRWWAERIHPEDRERVTRGIQACINGEREHWRDEYRLQRADGTYADVFDRAYVIRDPDGRPARVLGAMLDISERKRVEKLMREAVEHQQLLNREVSHRVKNNLAMVGSLLNLQIRSASDDGVRNALADARARIMAMAEAHDHLWHQKDVQSIDLDVFLADLCKSLRQTAPQAPNLHYQGAPIRVPADRAVPIALLVNELVTNALKYAYPDGVDGAIEVALSAEADRILLEVADHGVGLPDGFDPARATSSLGMRLIATLTRQLGAALDVASNDPGARFSVRVPL